MSGREARLRPAVESSPRVRPDEVINDLERQIGPRQGVVEKVQETAQNEWKPPVGGKTILGESALRCESI